MSSSSFLLPALPTHLSREKRKEKHLNLELDTSQAGRRDRTTSPTSPEKQSQTGRTLLLAACAFPMPPAFFPHCVVDSSSFSVYTLAACKAAMGGGRNSSFPLTYHWVDRTGTFKEGGHLPPALLATCLALPLPLKACFAPSSQHSSLLALQCIQ